MAQNSCDLCMRVLQRQFRSPAQARKVASLSSSRAFTTTRSRHENLILPVTPERAEGGLRTVPSRWKSGDLDKLKGGTIGTYNAYGLTELIYKECAIQADYEMAKQAYEDAEVPKTEDGEDLGVGGGWWHTDTRLHPTFSTWSQVTMLHMYILFARYRNFAGPEATLWQQHLLDHFFYDAENRMAVYHNMVARGTRNKYLKDLNMQWRGLIGAYDEGISKGDAVLASAVWRNVFKAKQDVDIKALAHIVSYMRRLLSELDQVPDEKLVTEVVDFGSPTSEDSVVKLRSAMLDLPLTTEVPSPKKA
ncbi:ubiquinol-cytochrome C chaperone-domain-containing protein [Calycina marina]|uniref:Ubiquinol-cytochrome C chaperone-domain-containing protein n=1 Tax=Calycina marina TaxID=1763456 RepID=A0A9P7YVC5_9HELO|nr:ubiquinol-cytochrome C chaperone-domain-containing protein [Calycina marina]